MIDGVVLDCTEALYLVIAVVVGALVDRLDDLDLALVCAALNLSTKACRASPLVESIECQKVTWW